MRGRLLHTINSLALSVTCGDTSPKGRGSGETASFVVCPETLPHCQSLPYEGGGKPDRA